MRIYTKEFLGPNSFIKHSRTLKAIRLFVGCHNLDGRVGLQELPQFRRESDVHLVADIKGRYHVIMLVMPFTVWGYNSHSVGICFSCWCACFQGARGDCRLSPGHTARHQFAVLPAECGGALLQTAAVVRQILLLPHLSQTRQVSDRPLEQRSETPLGWRGKWRPGMCMLVCFYIQYTYIHCGP